MSLQLSPCPFCGATAAVVVERSPGQFKVFCDNGPCSVSTALWGGRQPAIAAWNRRAPSPRREAEQSDADIYALSASLLGKHGFYKAAEFLYAWANNGAHYSPPSLGREPEPAPAQKPEPKACRCRSIEDKCEACYEPMPKGPTYSEWKAAQKPEPCSVGPAHKTGYCQPCEEGFHAVCRNKHMCACECAPDSRDRAKL
jgi:hypothetical protein